MWVFTVDRPALVLGSTQPDDVVDRAAARDAGVEVARRRSGGGAVWLEPGGTSWVDVLVPRADPLWDDDVGRAVHWLGDAWAAAIGAAAEVHRGGMVCSAESGRACFAGLGPGEVTIGGRKAVGISQRRTASGGPVPVRGLRTLGSRPARTAAPALPAGRDRARSAQAPASAATFTTSRRACSSP